MRELGCGAEVEAVDEDAVFGGAAEEAAVEAGIGEFEEEGVVVLFVDGGEVATGFFAEEEGVESHFAGGEDVEAEGEVAGGGCEELQEGAEEAAAGDGAFGEGKVVGMEGGEDEFDVGAVFVAACVGHGLVDEVEASAGVFGVGEFGADVADEVEEEAGGECWVLGVEC